jgi:hypothetical protein
MTNNSTPTAPATPCTRALLYLNERVEQMKLQGNHHHAPDNTVTIADVVMVHPPPSAPPKYSDAEDDLSNSSMFQTPSSNFKLSLVVTPRRLEMQAACEEEDNLLGLQEQLPPPPLPSQTEPHGRKRTRGTAKHELPQPPRPPPMLPTFLEDISPLGGVVNVIKNTNVFARHIPIHSPIAGTTSTPNTEFMAQLIKDDGTTAIARLSCSPFSRRLVLEHQDSFMAQHSFPVLDDQEDGEHRSINNEEPGGGGGLVSCRQALKMRRLCRREEDYDGFLQVEKELLL